MSSYRPGQTVDLFYSDSSSPFVFGGVFNFGTYLSTNSITMSSGDWVFINLGINDVFSAASDVAVQAIATDRFAKIEAMITSIKTAVSGVRIGILSMIPPPVSQDDFALVYLSQSRDRYRRNRDIWVDAAYGQFAGRAGSGVHLVPYGEHLDPAHGFPVTAVAANAYTTGTMRDVANNGVHPGPNGYYQLGASLYAYLLNAETWTPTGTVCNGAVGNGDFETAGTGGEPLAVWFQGVSNGSTVGRDTSVYRSGASSAKFVVSATVGSSCYLVNTSIITGKTYAYSFWAKSSTGSPVIAITSGANTTTFTLSNSWRRCAGVIVAGDSYILIGRSTLGVTFWVDDARIVRTN